MLLAAALEVEPDPDDADLQELVSSNICRCTGYVGILDAARTAARAAADARWRHLPVVDAAKLRADIDDVLDPSL
jgi:xanthine dehydrogenase iron-sulfur cluster and FAD-binding subunit A